MTFKNRIHFLIDLEAHTSINMYTSSAAQPTLLVQSSKYVAVRHRRHRTAPANV